MANCLVLNYKSADGTWDDHEYEEIQNFCFRAGTDIKIKVEATPCSFRITVNEGVVAYYNYKLPVASVRCVTFVTENDNGEIQLKSLTIGYPSK